MRVVGAKSQKSAHQVGTLDWMMMSIVTHVISPSSMAEEVRKHGKTLGETGQGLESVDMITPNTPLAQTWDKCFCAT